MRFLFIVLFSFFTFANEDLPGKWVFSSVGCRDVSLSPNTHVSKPISVGHAGIRASTVNIFENGNINMTLVTENDRYKEEFNSGTYTVVGDELRINGEDMTFYIVNDRLIVLGGEGEAADICCEFVELQNWRDYKREIQEWDGEHPAGRSWEEVKRKNGWDESKLVDDWEIAKRKCKEEERQAFVYVLGKVN